MVELHSESLDDIREDSTADETGECGEQSVIAKLGWSRTHRENGGLSMTKLDFELEVNQYENTYTKMDNRIKRKTETMRQKVALGEYSCRSLEKVYKGVRG